MSRKSSFRLFFFGEEQLSVVSVSDEEEDEGVSLLFLFFLDFFVDFLFSSESDFCIAEDEDDDLDLLRLRFETPLLVSDVGVNAPLLSDFPDSESGLVGVSLPFSASVAGWAGNSLSFKFFFVEVSSMLSSVDMMFDDVDDYGGFSV